MTEPCDEVKETEEATERKDAEVHPEPATAEGGANE